MIVEKVDRELPAEEQSDNLIGWRMKSCAESGRGDTERVRYNLHDADVSI